MRFSLIGDDYTSQSLNQAAEKTINWYRENAESPDATSPASLLPHPGLRRFADLNGVSGIRGMHEINGRCFAVATAGLVELHADETFTVLGPIEAGDGPASMASSDTQLLIASNGDLKVFDLNSNLLSAGLPDPVNVAQVGYANDTFIAWLAGTNLFRRSALLDATSWEPADIVKVDAFPDNIISMIVDHGEIGFAGRKNSVVYQYTGDLDNPFQPLGNGIIEQGSIARFSMCRFDNSTIWLGGDERGAAIVRKLNGYTPVRVSDHALEYAMQQYAKVEDAVGYVFQINGHEFYHLYFPTANKSWRLDAATGKWSEVGFWQEGQFIAHRSQCHVFCFGKHLVGDWKTDTIYEMSDAFTDDFGSELRRVRRSGNLQNEQKRLFVGDVTILLETGIAPIPPLFTTEGEPRGPYVMVRASKNGGHTWSEARIADCGQAGEYSKRIVLRRWGYCRNIIFEIAVSDPAQWRIVDGYVDVESEE